MKARIYQFLILLLQSLCGGLVVRMECKSLTEVTLIVLPFTVSVGILFMMYDKERENNESKN